MYNWKDKVWDGITIGLVSLTCIPLVIFALPIMLIAKLADKFWFTDYKIGQTIGRCK